MRGVECGMGKRSSKGTDGTGGDPGPSDLGDDDDVRPRRPPWPSAENDMALAGMLGCSALVGLGLWILLALALF
jgi:hypothetical protein